MHKAVTAQTSPQQERILDAVERCFARFGVAKTTLADVAAEAGLSRMTIYRQFKDRQALFEGAALRNISRHWRLIAAALSDIDELGEWLLEAALYYWRELSRDTSVQLYTELEALDEGLQVALSGPGLETMVEHIRPLFERAVAEGKVAPGLSAEDIAEWMHRTNFSLIYQPSPRMRDETHLRRWLGAQIMGGFVKT